MDRKRTLTKNQRQVYEYIKKRLSRRGESPTIVEIAKEMGVDSLRSVTQYLEVLERKGLIQRERYAQRGITLVDNTKSTEELVSVPVFASAGCGSPSVIAERIFDEYITVSSSLMGGERENLFVIKATGNSMRDAGISDGSFVLVEMIEDVSSGDLVVAIIDDTAVIKKISFSNNAIILYPVNEDPAYQPIIMQRDFKVFGKVIRVIKVERNEDYEIIPL